jgi:peptide/nickel transport system substrate-binding protein
MKANPTLQVTTKGYELFGPLAWMEVNNRTAPMNDKRFRKAMMYAIDRQSLVDRVWFGLGTIATSPVSSVTRFHDPDVPKYAYDPERAKALIAEMALDRSPTLKLLIPPFGEIWQRTAEFVRQQLGEVGITIQLENVDVATFGQRLANWEFDLSFNYTFQYGDPALGVERTYSTSAISKGILFSNTEGYSNFALDEIFAKAASVMRDDDRQALYSEAQRILVEDVPLVWLFEMAFPTVINRMVEDAVITGAGIRDNFADVRLQDA